MQKLRKRETSLTLRVTMHLTDVAFFLKRTVRCHECLDKLNGRSPPPLLSVQSVVSSMGEGGAATGRTGR
jgi:hypothetical protein